MGGTQSIVSKLVHRFLGKYIRDLDFALGWKDVYSGNIHIENVELNSDGLAEILDSLPIKVTGASLGTLRIKIPWTRLQTEPCVVEIKDVYIVAAPAPDACKRKTVFVGPVVGQRLTRAVLACPLSHNKTV